MKSLKKAILMASFAGGLVVSAQAQPAEIPGGGTPPQQPGTAQPGPDNPDQGGGGPGGGGPGGPGMDGGGAPEGGMQGQGDEAGSNKGQSGTHTNWVTARTTGLVVSQRSTKDAASASVVPGSTNAPAGGTNTPVAAVTSLGGFGDKGFTPNLHGASIDAVLNYMSDAAGFVIVMESPVSGTVDLWSKQPMSRDELVVLLNTVLAKNGFAAIQNGRILTIMTRDEARRRDVEIKMGNNPSSIPKDSAVVTQIVPVRSLNATQLSKDLAPLLPTDTSMIPNEAGNALIITDTQTVIHRVAELVRALDAAGSSANSIKTYTLKYADAKSLVSIIKELFPSSSSSSSGNQGGGFGRMNPMAFFGGPGRNSGSSDSSSQKASTRVSVVSDDNSNMLVVSAPDDIIPIITDLVSSLDVQTEDQAELKLFHLKYSDPTEMAELLTSLFPDDTSSSSSGNNRNSGPFGFFGGPPGMGGRSSSSSSTSDRLKRKNKVIAVADARTASVAVTADKTIMEQIDQLIAQLDSNPAKKMKVYVYSLQNADVTDVETVLNDLFYSSNSRSTSSSSYNSTSDALSTRKSSMIQQQSTTTSSFGSSSSSSQ